MSPLSLVFGKRAHDHTTNNLARRPHTNTKHNDESDTMRNDQSSSLLDLQQTFPTLCASIGIDARLRKALSRLNYVHPTLVQAKSIPLAVTSGRDL